jgi:hypothetical protein
MGKRDHHFAKVAEYKERFRHLPTETIRDRLRDFGGGLYKEAAIALREVLEEREREGADGSPETPPTPD